MSVRIEITGECSLVRNGRGSLFQMAKASGVRKTGKPWRVDLAVPVSEGEVYPPGMYRLADSAIYPGSAAAFDCGKTGWKLAVFPRLEPLVRSGE